MSRKSIYIVYYNDKYELPAFVGTVDEVAEWLGMRVSSVYSTLTKFRSGKRRAKFMKYKWEKVPGIYDLGRDDGCYEESESGE